MLLGPAKAAIAAIRLRPQLVHLHDPELIPWGLILKLLGIRVIYDSHEDLAAQVMSKPYLPPLLRPAVRGFACLLTAMADRRFDGIVAATPAIARTFSHPRTTVVQNFPILSDWRAPARGHVRAAQQIVFVGGISEIRGIFPMLDALALLAEREEVLLRLAGPIQPPSLLGTLQAHPAWGRVVYDPWLSGDEVSNLLAHSTVGLVLYQATPNHVESQPTKLFEYMAASLPVVASNFPLWREIVEGAGCGIVVDPRNSVAIADAVQSVMHSPADAEAMGACGAVAARERFSWESEAKGLIALYEQLLPQQEMHR